MTGTEALSEISVQLDGFVDEYARVLSKNLSVAVLGKSRRYTPIDTGHMRRATVLETDEQGPYLVTKAEYGRTQYYETLYHLRVNGEYASISKTQLVSMDASERKRIDSEKGSAKMVESYWAKLKLLKAAGKLTLSNGRWFERGFDDALADFNGASDQAVEKARAAIRSGKTYTVDI